MKRLVVQGFSKICNALDTAGQYSRKLNYYLKSTNLISLSSWERSLSLFVPVTVYVWYGT
jgi:hypothetical protein